MTALLGVYREPDDCSHVWAFDERTCTTNLPAHRCVIQTGHKHQCLCHCGSVPLLPPVWYVP